MRPFHLVLSVLVAGTAAPLGAGPHGHLGIVFARQTADLAARIPATVRDIRVRLGDAVEKDQVLIVLESTELDVDIAGREASLWAARADSVRNASELTQASAVLERREKAQDVFTKEEMETFTARRNAAAANLEAARATIAERTATLRALEDRKHSLALRAPFAGQVTACAGSRGDLVAAGEPLISLASTRDLWLRFAVPSADAGWLVPGRAIVAAVQDEGWEVRAEVRQVSPEIDPVSGMILAEAIVIDAEHVADRLPVGTVVRVAPSASDSE